MDSVNVPVGNREELHRWYRDHAGRLERALGQLQRELAEHCAQWGLRPTVKCRVKSFKSFYTKMLRRGQWQRRSDLEPVVPADLLGMRVVLPFLENVRHCERLIQSTYKVLEREHHGDHDRSDAFGYESIHYLVSLPAHIASACMLDDQLVCEIQLRTILQDAWAEVEHELLYKAEFSAFDEPLRRKLAALNANLTLSDTIFQEVRDYQHQLQRQLRRRRTAFFAMALGEEPPGDAVHPALVTDRHAAAEARADSISLGEATIDNLLLHALHAHNRGDFDTALGLYGKLLDGDDQRDLHAIVYIHRGMAHVARGDYPCALGDFSQAVALDPKNPKGYFHRALVHQLEHRFDDAMQDLQHCLDLDPAHSEALLSRSRLHFDQGRYEAAMRDCDEALALDPDWQQARQWRAQLVRKMRL